MFGLVDKPGQRHLGDFTPEMQRFAFYEQIQGIDYLSPNGGPEGGRVKWYINVQQKLLKAI